MRTKISSSSTPYLFPPKDLVAKYDQRGFPRRVSDLALSLFRQFQYWIALTYHRLTLTTPSQMQPTWEEHSRGLVVMLHGLHNFPVHWYKQLQLLENEKEIDAYAPAIKNRGACALNEAVASIFEIVLDYTRKHPGKPICLLGISNGARLTTWIETKLRKEARFTPVKVSNISGAHFGSSLLSLGNRLGISPLLVPKAVREELAYGSDCAKELLANAQRPLPWIHSSREYEYYATTEDKVIPDLTSTLPKIGEKTSYHVLHGHSHDSIVSAVAKDQIEACSQWIASHQPSRTRRMLALLY